MMPELDEDGFITHYPKGDPDYLPGDPLPEKTTPEPPGVFREDMHTRIDGPMRPADIASKAASLIGGNRAQTHGDFRQNHANIGALWTAYLSGRFATRHAIILSPKDVAAMMVLLKVARTMLGNYNSDDAVDACGYSAIMGAIAEQDAAVADLTRKG